MDAVMLCDVTLDWAVMGSYDILPVCDTHFLTKKSSTPLRIWLLWGMKKKNNTALFFTLMCDKLKG